RRMSSSRNAIWLPVTGYQLPEVCFGNWQPGTGNYLSALSNFKRMLTKLYGGHGPVYRNDNLFSYFLAISEIWSSNAFVFSRSTRNAAFMIILSPIGL